MIFWIIFYIVTVALAYLAIRQWHITNRVSPNIVDVIFIFVPVLNVLVAITSFFQISAKNEEDWIKSFFLIKK